MNEKTIKQQEANLRPNEKIMMILHRHWIVFVFKFGYIFILLLSTGILFILKTQLIGVFGTALFWGSMSIFWIFFLTFILISWVNDELDLFIVTDQRVIGIEQVSALSRKVTECALDRVQEVNAETSGILQTLLGYGHVHIHTASEHSDMIVLYAPHPVENGNKINTIIGEYRQHNIIQKTKL